MLFYYKNNVQVLALHGWRTVELGLGSEALCLIFVFIPVSFIFGVLISSRGVRVLKMEVSGVTRTTAKHKAKSVPGFVVLLMPSRPHPDPSHCRRLPAAPWVCRCPQRALVPGRGAARCCPGNGPAGDLRRNSGGERRAGPSEEKGTRPSFSLPPPWSLKRGRSGVGGLRGRQRGPLPRGGGGLP